MRRVAAHRVLTPRGLVSGGVVTLSDEGVVVDVWVHSQPSAADGFGLTSSAGTRGNSADPSWGAALDGMAGVEFFSGTLVPGLVNAHCHLELSGMLGAIPAGCGFEGFVDEMKEYHRHPTPPYGGGDASFEETRVQFWSEKMWAEGVVAVGDVCNGSSTFGLKAKSAIEYLNFVEIFGAAADPAGTLGVLDCARALGLRAGVTPHSLYSLTPEMFRWAAGTAEEDAERRRHAVLRPVRNGCEVQAETHLPKQSADATNPLSIHFLESDFEPRDSAERLVRQTPPDRSILLIHNCLVTQRDIDIVMGHFTAPVTWVVCPRSNRYITGLKPPVDLLRKNGLDIAIGTDSLASNETLSMGAEIAQIATITDAPVSEILQWATIGGARALGLDEKFGTIEVGKRPGLAIMNSEKITKI